jgi:hypothetical protein
MLDAVPQGFLLEMLLIRGQLSMTALDLDVDLLSRRGFAEKVGPVMDSFNRSALRH